jgi:hypothetical protein
MNTDDIIMPPDPSAWPTRTYFLTNDTTTSPGLPRDVSEMTTVASEMSGGGLLICMPDFDALTEQAIRSAG